MGMDPGTMALISLGTTVVGGIFQAIGQKNQADATAAAANYNAAVARNAATYAQQAGQVKAMAADRQTAAMIGRQRAAFASGGIDVNTGSPLDIQADTARFGRLNAMTIRNNAAREAWGYTAQSNLDVAAAKNAQTAGDWGMAGSLIGAGGSFFDKWSSYRTAGVDPFAIGAF